MLSAWEDLGAQAVVGSNGDVMGWGAVRKPVHAAAYLVPGASTSQLRWLPL